MQNHGGFACVANSIRFFGPIYDRTTQTFPQQAFLFMSKVHLRGKVSGTRCNRNLKATIGEGAAVTCLTCQKAMAKEQAAQDDVVQVIQQILDTSPLRLRMAQALAAPAPPRELPVAAARKPETVATKLAKIKPLTVAEIVDGALFLEVAPGDSCLHASKIAADGSTTWKCNKRVLAEFKLYAVRALKDFKMCERCF